MKKEKTEENQQTLPCGCLFGCFSFDAIKRSPFRDFKTGKKK